MNKTTCTAVINDQTYEIPVNTTYYDIVRDKRCADGGDAILVRSNGLLRELYQQITEDSEIELLSVRSVEGRDTYKRSLHFLFMKAACDVLQLTSPGDLALHFSNSNGYYYTVKGCSPFTSVQIDRIRERMQQLVDAALPLKKDMLSTRAAEAYFRAHGMPDKARLFQYRRVSTVNLYEIDGFRDYFYGYMVHDTGYLKWFDVASWQDGIILVLPDFKELTVHEFRPFPKIFATQTESERWADRIGINSVADLNDSITYDSIGHALLVAEALQESKVADIAKDICSRPHVKLVMIAGPSSSGKTTFSRRLSIQLSAHGKTPHPVSLDNFYLDRKLCPRDEDGNYDFECLESLDLSLIRSTFESLLSGARTEMPRFNFLTGEREYKGDYIQLAENDILVIEGIHGLNPRLSEGLAESSVFRIYISALTQLNVDAHYPISTTDGRLLRRIVRDYRTRGTNAQETIAMWPSVRRGEKNYIFPNQENADVVFNSALIYELSVLKVYAEPLLFQVPRTAPEYSEAKRLLKFLDYFLGTPSEQVPNNSILREFIGGSIFDV